MGEYGAGLASNRQSLPTLPFKEAAPGAYGPVRNGIEQELLADLDWTIQLLASKVVKRSSTEGAGGKTEANLLLFAAQVHKIV